MSGWKVAGVMTAGRYESTFARNHIDIAFSRAGVPLHVALGVYYGQCMQRCLEDCLTHGVDVVVTVDGDSLVRPDDITRLLSILYQDPKLDAVAGIQAKRGVTQVLGSIDGAGSVDTDGSPFHVSTAHFGLTAIRMESLARTPKPWFFCQPDPNGSWSDDRTDGDIWFWRQWQAAGNTVAIDPQTRIGHLQEMATVLDPATYEIRHIYPGDWADG